MLNWQKQHFFISFAIRLIVIFKIVILKPYFFKQLTQTHPCIIPYIYIIKIYGKSHFSTLIFSKSWHKFSIVTIYGIYSLIGQNCNMVPRYKIEMQSSWSSNEKVNFFFIKLLFDFLLTFLIIRVLFSHKTIYHIKILCHTTKTRALGVT